MRSKETELKFESTGNTQFKFVPIERPKVFMAKISALCQLLKIELGRPQDIRIEDEYYDDDNYSLRQQGCHLRYRKEGRRSLVTLKSSPKELSNGSIRRSENEFKCSKKRFLGLIENPQRITRAFKEKLQTDVSAGAVKLILTIHNSRILAPLNTKFAKYSFVYDRYYYYYGGNYSEKFSEIEIELEKRSRGEDQDLGNLVVAIRNVLGYSPHQKSKLERGIEFFNKGMDSSLPVYAIAFDIVKYTRRENDVQKRMIQVLNRFVNEAIKEVRTGQPDDTVIYLPTGDGMIIVFEDKPDAVVPIIRLTQKSVKEFNQSNPDIKFEFRTGLHCGPVFKFTDINDNLNFAGNGINLAQRVMSLGEAWHILATKEGYEHFGNFSSLTGFFKPVGKRTIKNKQVTLSDVYNVYDEDQQFGNPAPPPK